MSGLYIQSSRTHISLGSSSSDGGQPAPDTRVPDIVSMVRRRHYPLLYILLFTAGTICTYHLLNVGPRDRVRLEAEQDFGVYQFGGNDSVMLEPGEKYDGRFEIPTEDMILQVSNDPTLDQRIEHLQKISIPFLPTYKNPCWFEVVDPDTIYSGNAYVEFKDQTHTIQSALEKFQSTLKARLVDNGSAWCLRCLPYFYIVGAPRSGTTDLYATMVNHKHIALLVAKETWYWNRMRYLMPQVVGHTPVKPYYKTPIPLHHYIEFLDISAEEVRASASRVTEDPNVPPEHRVIIGDFTPSYIYDFDAWRELPGNEQEPTYIAADLIHTVTPQARMIFMLRNPIDRLYSEYTFWNPNAAKSPDKFHQLVVDSLNGLVECQRSHTVRYCLYDRDTNIKYLPIRYRAGLYYPYLQHWLNVFPRNQTLVLRFEDYRDRPEETMTKIFEFLDVETMDSEWYSYATRKKPRNQSNKETMKGQVWNTTKDMLHRLYNPWNKRLADMLQDGRFLWEDYS